MPETVIKYSELADAIEATETLRETYVANESARISAENTRVSQEGTRVSQENTRQSQESTRQFQEAARALNEITRLENEDARGDAEFIREENEVERQQNEIDRQNNTSTTINNVNSATSAANTATNNANAAAAAANDASNQALAAAGINASYISETTSNPGGAVPANGTKGAKRTSGGNWQRLEVIAGVWTAVGSPLVSGGSVVPYRSTFFVSKTSELADYSDLDDAIAALPAEGGTIVLDVIRKGQTGYTPANITIDNVSIVSPVPPVLDFVNDVIANDCAVIDGQLYVTANNFTAYNIAIRTNTVALNNDGLELNGTKTNAVLKNIAILGYERTSAFHCLLIENYDNVTVENVQTINNVWGTAIKSSNVNFTNYRSKNHDFGPLIIKGDSLTGDVENINCSNVNYVSTADGSGNYKGALFIQNVHSSSTVTNVNISNVVLKNGIIRLENLDTSPDLGIDNVNFSNIVIDLPAHSSRNVGVQINDVAGAKVCYGRIAFDNTQINGAFFYGFYDINKHFSELYLANTWSNQPNILFRRKWSTKLWRNTTDATSTRLTTDGKTVAGYNYLKIPADTVWIMTIDVSGVKDDASKAIYWKRVVVLRNDGGVVTSDLAGGSTSLITTTSIGSPGYAVGVSADDSNNAIDIQVVGAVDENVMWIAAIDITELSI